MTRARCWTLIGAALLTLDACGERPRISRDWNPGPVPAELAEGERLFDATCSRCHGPRALGAETGPPLVHEYYEPNHHADAAFRRAVALGVPEHHWRFGRMPPISGVPEAAVDRITAYVRWLQREAGVIR